MNITLSKEPLGDLQESPRQLKAKKNGKPPRDLRDISDIQSRESPKSLRRMSSVFSIHSVDQDVAQSFVKKEDVQQYIQDNVSIDLLEDDLLEKSTVLQIIDNSF